MASFAFGSTAKAEVPVRLIRVVGPENVSEATDNPSVQMDPGLPAARQLLRALSIHLGKPATEEHLGLMADVLVDHLKRHDWPISLVTVWDEGDSLARGEVTLQVQQGRLGDIAIVGGSKRRQLAVARRLQPLANAPLNGMTLQRRLDGLAFSPWLACTPQIGPGSCMDTANLLLTLKDESPLHAFASYENNGVDPLGRNRYTLGLQWLNAFALGHEFTLLGTVADDPDTLTMGAVNWRIPLPWRHELRLSGYYAETNTAGEILAIPLDVNGVTWQAGARYVIPWRLSEHWRSEWQLGFDSKSFDTGFNFGSTAALSETVGIGEIVLGTQWFYETEKNHLRFGLEALHGEPGWAEGHEEAQFQGIVAGADPQFTILRSDITYQHDFRNDMQTSLRLGAQWSDTALLPSEELALASINAVRGYPERSIRASRGAWASLEVRSPQWEVCKSQIKLRALAFADAGYSADETLPCGCGDSADEEEEEDHSEEPDTPDYIASAGLGLRLELTQHLHLRCDLAFPLIERDEPRVHLVAVVRF
jgi:hemolysin activation/secretion protein